MSFRAGERAADDVTPGGPVVAATGGPTFDQYRRRLRTLRISVTDRCNLRCQYCMPEEEYTWLAREDLLSFEEISRLTDVFISLGVEKVRLTGGEPLLRRDVSELVRQLASKQGIRDLAMTTNGVRLAEHAESLREAGLHRVTVSLDTLRPERFRALARRDSLSAVLEGIRSLARVGFTGTKIDTVVIRGVNDDELTDLIEFGRQVPAEVRFIEYMDVGGATGWSWEKTVSRDEILATLTRYYGSVEPVMDDDESATADRFALPDGTTFGIISSTTQPFCGSCDRARLTADGMWYLCLYALIGIDLRTPLRQDATDDELRDVIASAWRARRDRGAEARLAARNRRPLLSVAHLRRDPHLEMHTRGG
ncbi:GTP 3',8-cyclase MoaA [Carbonactinospora thermoautotrophica]|uniref:GTP 3',8-cyclase MoaA n=1 Tax=Carbonactinospora thermoautotrophica TaxID=1469144 RepID=UPI00099EBD06|nr:GTP 3',8-cyclase MoaA [Carbonactinospora thermoautotrophica]